jgi:hypothetical protein
MKKKVKIQVLEPGPYATHFQEYAHDNFFRGKLTERETYTQRPRVSLGDFLANRLRKVVLENSEAEEKS